MILKSMAAMTALNLAKAGATVLTSVLMAGSVSPQDYGLVALAIPMMALVTLLTDLGLSSAVVREPALSARQAGAALALTGVIGALGGVLVAAVAGPTERGLAMPGLEAVLLAFAAVTACSIWATVPRALLERHLAYTRVAAVEGAALAVALACFGVLLAAGAGIAALAGFHVALQAVRAAGFAWLARGLVQRGGTLGSVAPLVRVGCWVFLSNLLSFAARNLDRLLISSVLGAAALGLYGLAYQFMILPLMLVAWPASGVLLATLSRMRHDAHGQAAVVCAVFTATATLALPLMAFVAVGLRYPVGAFLSPQWHGLAGLLAVLAPVGAVQALAVYNGAVLVERGRVRLGFLLGLLNSAVVCGAVAASVWAGLPALVAAYAVAASFMAVVMVAVTCKVAGIGAARLGTCLLPGVLATACGLLAMGASGGLRPESTAQWLLSTLAYAVAAASSCALLRGKLRDALRVLMHTRMPAMGQ